MRQFHLMILDVSLNEEQPTFLKKCLKKYYDNPEDFTLRPEELSVGTLNQRRTQCEARYQAALEEDMRTRPVTRSAPDIRA